MKVILLLATISTLLTSANKSNAAEIKLKNECSRTVDVHVNYQDRYREWKTHYQTLDHGETFHVGSTNLNYYYWHAITVDHQEPIEWLGDRNVRFPNGTVLPFRRNQIEEYILPIRCTEYDSSPNYPGRYPAPSGKPYRLKSEFGGTQVFGNILSACNGPSELDYRTKDGSDHFVGKLYTNSFRCSSRGLSIKGIFNDRITQGDLEGCSGLFSLTAASKESAYYKIKFKVTGPSDVHSHCSSIGREYEIDLHVSEWM